MNFKILDSDNLVLKRLFSLDTQTYSNGTLDSKTKEMPGRVASMVLRCDDCVKYHLKKCYDEKISRENIFEVFSVTYSDGGTIVIPHTRRAVEFWEELEVNE